MAHLPKPRHCNQNWLAMQPTAGGRTCAECQKTIVDFSKKSWKEITEKQAANGNSLCGMYSQKQLDYWGHEVLENNSCIKKAAALAGLFATVSFNAIAQAPPDKGFTIIGKVTDTTGQAIPFVNLILLKNGNSKIMGKTTGTTSGLGGIFTLEVTNLPDGSFPDALLVASVGYGQQIIKAEELLLKTDTINIKLREEVRGPETLENVVYTTAFFVREPTRWEKVKWKFKKWFSRKEE